MQVLRTYLNAFKGSGNYITNFKPKLINGMAQKAENTWEICKGILYLQRKTRLIANELGASGLAGIGISIAEGLLLHILASEENKTVKDLAEILNLERSWVSRLVSTLEERKFALSKESPEDKRAKFVEISAKGSESIVKLNAFRFQVMQRAISDLQIGSQNEFSHLLKKTADSLKAHRFIDTPESHPIDAELARLSWALGVMGENFLGSGMGVAQFHIYEVLSASNTEILASDVNDILPFDMSTITRSIVNFEKAGLVSRKTAAHDKRSVYISLSRKGEAVWKEKKKIAVSMFSPVKEHLSLKEQARLVELFKEAVATMPLSRAGDLRSSIEIKEINNNELARQAKEFSEANIFSSRLFNIDKARSSYLLYSGHDVCGIASVEQADKNSKDDKFTIALSGLNDKECSALMKQLQRWRRRKP